MKKPQVLKLALSLSIISGLTGCATYHPMESVADKMDRYNPKKESPAPSYSLSINDQQVSHGRGPASSTNLVPKLSYNNKQLYFMTLLDQYYRLGQFASTPVPALNHCPANHSALITYQEKYSAHWPKRSLPEIKDTTLNKDQYPELQLPVTLDAPTPIVADVIKGQSTQTVHQTVQKALDGHLVKTYNELKTLCDSGASDNYYSFENLLSETSKGQKVSPSSIMKGPVFSNMALIKSLSRTTGRTIASGDADGLSTEAMARAKASWIKDYLKQFK